MNAVSDCAALIANRENLYGLLARLYRVEADQALLDAMGRMAFPADCGDAALDEGYRLLGSYLHTLGPTAVTDLAVDYAKVFLGAGRLEGAVAFPYESVYTSPDGLIMQDARDAVLATYRAKGLDKAKALDVPEDHIALEFAFMAHLCNEARHASETGEARTVAGSLAEQKAFLEQHLLNWVPRFCADILKCADTDFYRAAARITDGFLRLETAIIVNLLADQLP